MTTVVYLGGFGRSGTTLVERVLDQLPDVCGLGEVVHLWFRGLLWDELCGCGQPFSSCEFWQEVGKAAFGGWETVDAKAVHRLGLGVDRSRHVPALVALPAGARLRRQAREYADWYARIYAAVAAVTGAKVVVDSSKNASLAFSLREHPDIDLKILHVVRDARGVAHSWTKDVRRPEAGAEHQLMDKYSPARSATLWTAHNLSFEVLRRQGSEVRRLRYEQFASDPQQTVRGIQEWLGLPLSELPFLPGDAVELRASHTVAGNPMRFRTGRLELRMDEEWRAGLAAGDRRRVTAVTWPLLLRYGYHPTMTARQ
jgi:hypothetical protein